MTSTQRKHKGGAQLISYISELGTIDQLSDWDNQKTKYLNLMLLVSIVSSAIFGITNLILSDSSMALAGGVVVAFNAFLFTLHYFGHPYLARTACAFGYPLFFAFMVITGKGEIAGEYPYFLMLLLSVMFFRKRWRQLIMMFYLTAIYFAGAFINARQAGGVVPYQDILNNVIIFLATTYTLLIIVDIFIRQILLTRRQNKKLVSELSNSNQELKRLNYMVSHDLRTPLRQIVAFSDLALIANQDHNTPLTQDYMQQVGASARSLYALTDDLLSLANLDNEDLQREELCLDDVFTRTVHQFTSHEDQVLFETDHQDLCLTGSPVLLGMLLQNLVENGIKYNESPRKHIVLRARSEQQGVSISVIDNGIGIDPEFQEKIFEAFQRLHTKEVYQGSGLGLSIVKKIMELHDGTITLKPRQRGAEFVLFFPAQDQLPLTDTAPSLAKGSLKVFHKVKRQRAIF